MGLANEKMPTIKAKMMPWAEHSGRGTGPAAQTCPVTDEMLLTLGLWLHYKPGAVHAR